MLTKQDILQKIRDDLYLTGKHIIMDQLPENKNALFIGKFRIPTKAHINIVEEALKDHPHVVICIVKAKKDVKESLSFEQQSDMFESIFGDKISVITHCTGNLTSIINKSPKRIKSLIVGSDRIGNYDTQLKRHPTISVIEVERDMESADNVSATNVFQAIRNQDEDSFRKMMDGRNWMSFNELRKPNLL